MRISDWSSDVCSSDLTIHKDTTDHPHLRIAFVLQVAHRTIHNYSRILRWHQYMGKFNRLITYHLQPSTDSTPPATKEDRKSVVKGKSVSVRVDLGGRRFIKKKKNKTQ